MDHTTKSVPERPPWSLGEALILFLIGTFTGALLGSLILSAAGHETVEDASLELIAALQAAQWIPMIGLAIALVRWRGGDLRNDLGLSWKWVDVPIGVAVGVASQLVMVPVVSWAWVKILDRNSDDLKGPACELAVKADRPLAVALLIVITVLVAPVAEEIVFRSLIQRPLVARLGLLGVVITSLLFGLAHFQVLQAPALIVFGLVLGTLTFRGGRLGTSIAAHMAFNATTIVSLLVLSASVDEECAQIVGLIR